MICGNKLKEYAAKMTDVELSEAVSHLNNITFDKDDVIRLMYEYAVSEDDDYGLTIYLSAITKALCNEAIKRLRCYSPEFG